MIPAIGVCTYNRPDRLEKALRSLAKHLPEVPVFVRNDGSDPKHNGAYARAYRRHHGTIIVDDRQNLGVAKTKNQLLSLMIEDGSDYLFIMEDDLEVVDPEAVYGYIAASSSSGCHHLNYLWGTGINGAGNPNGPIEVDGPVSFFHSMMAGWSLYTAESLVNVGLMDENFHNAWEDVELSARLSLGGWNPPLGWPVKWPDATGSRDWVREQRGVVSTQTSAQSGANISKGLRYWEENKPETYQAVFQGPLTEGEAW